MRYLVDTNVILDDWKNIFKIDDQNYTIVLTETILKELDKFKKGFDSINYNTREFIRFLSESDVVDVCDSYMKVRNRSYSIDIEIFKDVQSPTCVNSDDIIINTITEKFKSDEIKFISNDILFRTKVILAGYTATQISSEFKNLDEFDQQDLKLEIQYDSCFLNKEYFKLDELNSMFQTNISDKVHILYITESTGKMFVLVREDQTTFRKIDLKSTLRLFKFVPRNLEQRLLWEALLNQKNHIVVVEGIAGTSKTLSAVLCALELVRTKKFDKVTYIRKTIISGDENDELGFLPGSLNSKMSGYLHPLKDNLELIARSQSKKKKDQITKEYIETQIQNIENEYNINYEYIGHLRGRNLSGVIIIDEAQNLTIQNLALILSRITEDSRIFILGSTKQIDNPYLTKSNNALSFMLNHCGTFDPIQIQGMKVSKVERGPITQWIEKVTS